MGKIFWPDQEKIKCLFWTSVMELMKIYSMSHGLLIPDALIAATAITKNLPLWTFNQKDFKFIDDLVLFDG